MSHAMSDIAVKRLAGSLGAEVTGLDLSDEGNNEAFATIHKAFLDHSVLVFRDQSLEPDALVRFSKRFGPLEQHVLTQFSLPENSDVFVVSNVKEKGKPIGAIRAGQYWHSDCSYLERPTAATILHAHEIPSYGGDTMFTSMAAAYDELSDVMKDMLDGLTAIHDYTNAYDTFFSKFPDRPTLSDEQKAKVPPVEHPVVSTHPDNGRKVLFVNPGFTRRIVGMNEAESRAILDFLFEHSQQPHLIYRHHWRCGDVVMWDNRSTWHLAVADYDMGERRHMHRTSVAGEVPVSPQDL